MAFQPISITDVLDARRRIQPYLSKTPLRSYRSLDSTIGHGVSVLVKHENHQPTQAFKVRNNLSAVTRLTKDELRRGLVAATRGNHGQALAWAGALLGAPVVICVPVGNNPEKNEAMRGFGARLIEEGKDYDEAVLVARSLVERDGMRMVHSTNDPDVIAGAGTLALEILEEAPHVDALVIAVGGGSQAVGAIAVARALRPDLEIYGVQAQEASAIHDSWQRKTPLQKSTASTFADGLATRQTYEMTFPALLSGLKDFVTVEETEIAEAIRIFLRTTHNLSEGAGAAGLAGLFKLAPRLTGRTVAVVNSGANIDAATLKKVMNSEI